MTAAQLARINARRARLVETEFRRTLNDLGVKMTTFCRGLLTETVYAIPEDTTSTGRKKWTRTGKLRDAEHYELRGNVAVVMVNKVAYAEPRHEAGKPGRRNINPIRVAHWRDEMMRTFRPIVLDAIRETMARIARRGIGT